MKLTTVLATLLCGFVAGGPVPSADDAAATTASLASTTRPVRRALLGRNPPHALPKRAGGAGHPHPPVTLTEEHVLGPESKPEAQRPATEKAPVVKFLKNADNAKFKDPQASLYPLLAWHKHICRTAGALDCHEAVVHMVPSTWVPALHHARVAVTPDVRGSHTLEMHVLPGARPQTYRVLPVDGAGRQRQARWRDGHENHADLEQVGHHIAVIKKTDSGALLPDFETPAAAGSGSRSGDPE